MKLITTKSGPEAVGEFQHFDFHSMLEEIPTDEQEDFATLTKGYATAFGLRSFFLELGAEVENDGPIFFVTMTTKTGIDLVLLVDGDYIHEEYFEMEFDCMEDAVKWIQTIINNNAKEN